MIPRTLLVAGFAALCLGSGAALAHDKADQLGKVTFPTSCSPKVQALFETGVAMLHSYWFGEARKTFDAVLKDDPELRDRVLGHRARLPRQLARGAAAPRRTRRPRWRRWRKGAASARRPSASATGSKR